MRPKHIHDGEQKALLSGQFSIISLIRAVRTSIGHDEDEWHTISASVTANGRWQSAETSVGGST